tara:strand:+ start:451 stop:720 length:270 start_codon:yes stop_codon:yes gene_type:complete
MNENFELKALRCMREINIAIRDLENQSSVVSKRYKRGIKLLQTEICSIEASLDDGGTIEGCEPWNVQSAELKTLIADPKLSSIAEDNIV